MRNDRTALTTGGHPDTGLMSIAGSIFERAQQNADQVDSESPSPAGKVTHRAAELRDLRVEVERLRVERNRLLEMQSQVLQLLGTDRPDRLIHDLRNVLNERALFRALAETVM
jgi:hypothetical protein